MDPEMEIKQEPDIYISHTVLQPTDLSYLMQDPKEETAGNQETDTEIEVKQETNGEDVGHSTLQPMELNPTQKTKQKSAESDPTDSTEKTPQYHSIPGSSKPLSENGVILHSNTKVSHFVCSQCGRMFRNGCHEKRFACDVCKKSFCSISILGQHTLTHGPEKPFKCSYCDRSFDNRFSLSSHFRCHKERRHECKDCNKKFISPLRLAEHSLTHAVIPYKCSYCDETFTESESFVAHFKTHTGDKMYTCIYCNRNYFKSSNLSRHLTKHLEQKHSCTLNSPTQKLKKVSPYSRRATCGVCGLTFASRVALKNHITTHPSGP